MPNQILIYKNPVTDILPEGFSDYIKELQKQKDQAEDSAFKKAFLQVVGREFQESDAKDCERITCVGWPFGKYAYAYKGKHIITIQH